MGMETTLPEKVESAGLDDGPGASTDGLSAAVLAEQVEQTGIPGGPPSPKRIGRPPIHGLYSQAAGSDGKHPATPAGPEPLPAPEVAPGTAGPAPRVTIPPDLLAKVVCESLTFGENAIARALEGQGKLAGLTAEEIAPQLKRAELGEQRKQLVAELAPYAAEELGLDAEVSPCLAICLLVGPWALSATAAYFTLAGLAKEKALRERLKEKEEKKP